MIRPAGPPARRLTKDSSGWTTFNGDGSVAEYGYLYVDADGVVKFRPE